MQASNAKLCYAMQETSARVCLLRACGIRQQLLQLGVSGQGSVDLEGPPRTRVDGCGNAELQVGRIKKPVIQHPTCQICT